LPHVLRGTPYHSCLRVLRRSDWGWRKAKLRIAS
jgi:hypothetical protein